MTRPCLATAVTLLAAVVLAGPAFAGLTISVVYDDTQQDPLSSGTFNAQEKAVISQAVTDWQNAIQTNMNVTINLYKSNLAGSLLGWASNYQTDVGDTDADGKLNGTPVSGQIQVDDRLGGGELPFFVDASPGDNTEFGPGNTAYHWLTGPVNTYDMLSLVRHEIGHVLGFSNSFDGFDDGLAAVPAEGGRWVYVFGAAATIGPSAGYLAGALGGFLNGAVYMREGDEHGTNGPRPSHVDEDTTMPPGVPFTGQGFVAGFFPDDLLNGTLALGERMAISNVDLDILADAHGYSVVPEPATMALLLLGGLGLGVVRRRRR